MTERGHHLAHISISTYLQKQFQMQLGWNTRFWEQLYKLHSCFSSSLSIYAIRPLLSQLSISPSGGGREAVVDGRAAVVYRRYYMTVLGQ